MNFGLQSFVFWPLCVGGFVGCSNIKKPIEMTCLVDGKKSGAEVVEVGIGQKITFLWDQDPSSSGAETRQRVWFSLEDSEGKVPELAIIDTVGGERDCGSEPNLLELEVADEQDRIIFRECGDPYSGYVIMKGELYDIRIFSQSFDSVMNPISKTSSSEKRSIIIAE